MSILGEIAIGILIFFLGMFLSISLMSKDCAAGKPQIVDGKVYRCVETTR